LRQHFFPLFWGFLFLQLVLEFDGFDSDELMSVTFEFNSLLVLY
jgi:hypothetical protein